MDGQYLKRIIAGTINVGFNTLRSSIKESFNKLNFRRIIAVICLCSVFGVSTASLDFAYAVSYDGEVLCYTGSWAELQAVIDSVEKTASDALGYDYTINSEVTTRLSLGITDLTDLNEIRGLLLDSIPEIEFLYTLSLDGEPICAFNNGDSARQAIDKLMSKYVNDNTVAIEFIGDVTIDQKYVGVGLLVNEETALKLMMQKIKVKTQDYKTVEENITYSVECLDDDSMVVGQTITQTEGENGKALAEYKMTCINGIISNTETVNYLVLQEPIEAVVLKGTREKVSSGNYIWPCSGSITSDFGYRNVSIGSSNHKGIDIADSHGTAIYAADGGIVTRAESYYGYGNMIIIEHDNGDLTYYAHLNSFDIEVGDLVKQGDYLGSMGCTGTASGTHLHFEYHPAGGSAVDPMTILPTPEKF